MTSRLPPHGWLGLPSSPLPPPSAPLFFHCPCLSPSPPPLNIDCTPPPRSYRTLETGQKRMNIQDKSPPCAEQLLKPGSLSRAYLQLTDSGRGGIAGLSVGSRRIKGIVYYRGIGCSSRVKGKMEFCKRKQEFYPCRCDPLPKLPSCPPNTPAALPWRMTGQPFKNLTFHPHHNEAHSIQSGALQRTTLASLTTLSWSPGGCVTLACWAYGRNTTAAC